MLAGRARSAWVAALLVLAGCTALAGLDGDYTLGKESASSGSVANATAASAGGSSASVGSAATTGSGAAPAGGFGGAATGGAGGSPTVSCDSQYGGIMGYIFCSETATTCDFRALLNAQSSCSEQCTSSGGECIDAFANGDGTCNHNSVVGCTYATATDLVCLCSKGCGGGPPCSAGLQCISGSCT